MQRLGLPYHSLTFKEGHAYPQFANAAAAITCTSTTQAEVSGSRYNFRTEFKTLNHPKPKWAVLSGQRQGEAKVSPRMLERQANFDGMR